MIDFKINDNEIKGICQKLDTDLLRYYFLSKGNHNANYVLETSKGKFVLRIENNLQFNNLEKEFNFLKKAEKGLGPKVYFFDKSKNVFPRKYLIEEFIEGKHPLSKVSNNFVVQMAKWFKRLHRTKTSKKPDCAERGYYSPNCAIKPYYSNYLKYKNHLDNELQLKIDKIFERCIEICKENEVIFSGIKKFSLLHNDPSKDNILIKGNKIRLIDWEFVSYGLIEKDLINFLESYKLNPSQKILFLENYGYKLTYKNIKKFNIISILNSCAGIGYLVWRLDTLKDKKAEYSKTKKEAISRIKKEIKNLEKTIKNLDKLNIL